MKNIVCLCVLVMFVGCSNSIFSKKIHSISQVQAPVSWNCSEEIEEVSWACEIVSRAYREFPNVHTDKEASEFAVKYGLGFFTQLKNHGVPSSVEGRQIVLDCNRKLLAMVATLSDVTADSRTWHNAYSLRIRDVSDQLLRSIRRLHKPESTAKG